jgi:uncharacterized protein
MSLLIQLEKDSVTERKKRSSKGAFLSTLLSEVRMRAKNDGNRSPTDDDVVKVVQKFQKGAIEARDFLIAANKDPLVQVMEIQVLSGYLPTMLSDTETESAISSAIEATGASSIKEMGQVMSMLKETHGQKIDMKLASQLIRKKLS